MSYEPFTYGPHVDIEPIPLTIEECNSMLKQLRVFILDFCKYIESDRLKMINTGKLHVNEMGGKRIYANGITQRHRKLFELERQIKRHRKELKKNSLQNIENELYPQYSILETRYDTNLIIKK